MEIIKHRINLREDLASLSDEYGAEIDIRYHNNELVLHHDPFNHQDDKNLLTLEEFLSNWQNNKTLIFNIKSEGIENKCIELANKYNIKKWFFLDLSMPYFVKYINILRLEKNKGFNRDNLAVRFSDEEPIEYCINFLDEVSWVWIDYFHLHPLNDITYKIFKDHKSKICLVSPELQGKDPKEIAVLRKNFIDFRIDAVCTKYPDLWISKE